MDRQVKVHGKDVFNEQNNFFSAMDSLFAQGNLGGCKIIATKGNVNWETPAQSQFSDVRTTSLENHGMILLDCSSECPFMVQV